jgi:hypothetical protein
MDTFAADWLRTAVLKHVSELRNVDGDCPLTKAQAIVIYMAESPRVDAVAQATFHLAAIIVRDRVALRNVTFDVSLQPSVFHPRGKLYLGMDSLDATSTSEPIHPTWLHNTHTTGHACPNTPEAIAETKRTLTEAAIDPLPKDVQDRVCPSTRATTETWRILPQEADVYVELSLTITYLVRVV